MAFPTRNKGGRFTGPAVDATSWSIGAPTGGWLSPDNAIPAGQITRWIAVVTSDGIPTLTVGAGSDAWVKLAQTNEATSQCTQAIFYIDTTAGYAIGANIPTLNIASTASEQFSAAIGAFTAAVGSGIAHLAPTNANGSSTNSDPPAITNSLTGAKDFTVICTRGGDGTAVPTVAPTNYSTIGNTASSGANGVATAGHYRNINVAAAGSENPGVYTVTTEQWISHTFAIYETPNLQALLGTFTYTGQDVGMVVASPLDAGTFTYSGQSINLPITYDLAAAAGTFTYSGQNAGLTAAYGMTAAVGTFTYNGQPAAMPVAMAASLGVFSYTGQAINLTRGLLLGAGLGTFSYAGQSVGTVRGYVLAATVGTFTLNGQNIAMPVAVGFAAAQGSFSYAGQDVGLPVALRFSADVGTFTYTGEAAGLALALGFMADAGVFIYTGYPVATASVNVSLVANPGTFSYAGQPVRYTLSGDTFPPSGSTGPRVTAFTL